MAALASAFDSAFGSITSGTPFTSIIRKFSPNLHTVAQGAGDFADVLHDFSSVSTPFNGPNLPTLSPIHFGHSIDFGAAHYIQSAFTLNTALQFPSGIINQEELRIRALPIAGIAQQGQNFASTVKTGVAQIGHLVPIPLNVVVRNQSSPFSRISGLPGAFNNLTAYVSNDGIIRLFTEDASNAQHVVSPLNAGNIRDLFAHTSTGIVVAVSGWIPKIF